MNSRIIGQLIQDSALGELSKSKKWVSKQAIETPFFDNKKIIYHFAFDQNEKLTLESADLALENFFAPNADLKQKVGEEAFQNWTEFNEAVGYLDAIEAIRSIKDRPKWMELSLQNSLWLEKLTNSKLVWDYFDPTNIVITMDRNKKREGVFILIYCNCDWEDEHGLQIVLRNGNELIRISEQDGNLY